MLTWFSSISVKKRSSSEFYKNFGSWAPSSEILTQHKEAQKSAFLTSNTFLDIESSSKIFWFQSRQAKHVAEFILLCCRMKAYSCLWVLYRFHRTFPSVLSIRQS